MSDQHLVWTVSVYEGEGARSHRVGSAIGSGHTPEDAYTDLMTEFAAEMRCAREAVAARQKTLDEMIAAREHLDSLGRIVAS